MGENFSEEKLAATLDALQASFEALGAKSGTRQYSEVFRELLARQHDLKAC